MKNLFSILMFSLLAVTLNAQLEITSFGPHPDDSYDSIGTRELGESVHVVGSFSQTMVGKNDGLVHAITEIQFNLFLYDYNGWVLVDRDSLIVHSANTGDLSSGIIDHNYVIPDEFKLTSEKTPSEAIFFQVRAFYGRDKYYSSSTEHYEYEVDEYKNAWVTLVESTIDVSVSPTSGKIPVGSSITLAETVLPASAPNKNVSWSSDDNSIATVVDGVVTGVSPGVATITVKTEEKGKIATATVTVYTPVTSVILNKTSDTILIGENTILTETVFPENATYKEVSWHSVLENIATVSDGVVTGVSVGTTEVIVTTDDGHESDTCVIVVNPILVSDIELDKTSQTILVGETTTLIETITPPNATNKKVFWSSKTPEVATVSNGVVTGVSVGTAEIIVTTEDGNKSDTCLVTVNPVLVSDIELDKTSQTILVGETTTLVETITPDSAANKKVTWNSDKPEIATVSNGVVAGLSVGTAIITVTTEDGDFEASAFIFVKESVSSLNNPELENLSLYPSPASNFVAIKGLQNGDYKVKIYNISGTELSNSNISSINEATIDISSLKAGSYILTISNKETIKNLRFNKITE